jgi:ERCC4-type nuclease
MTEKKEKRQSNCPITADPHKREEANRATAAIKGSLPDCLAHPALRALASSGINELADFSMFTESELAKMHGIGPNALVKIKTAMEEAGLSFIK